MCTAFASAQWLNPSWRPFMKTLRGRRVAQNFLRDDNEPGHGGNRLAVVYAKRQPAQSVRAFVRAPAGPSCTRWTLVHPLDPRAPAGPSCTRWTLVHPLDRRLHASTRRYIVSRIRASGDSQRVREDASGIRTLPEVRIFVDPWSVEQSKHLQDARQTDKFQSAFSKIH